MASVTGQTWRERGWGKVLVAMWVVTPLPILAQSAWALSIPSTLLPGPLPLETSYALSSSRRHCHKVTEVFLWLPLQSTMPPLLTLNSGLFICL